MLNARTWHWLYISAQMSVPAVLAFLILLRIKSPLVWVALAIIVWGIVFALFGAIYHVIYSRGRLYMGCPFCNARSRVVGGDRGGTYLDCPQCGELCLTLGRLTGLKSIPLESNEDEPSDSTPDTASPFLAPKRHPISFVVIFLPVIGSVVAASIIYKFIWLYIIPGIWCYVAGGLLINGIYDGTLSDNHGMAVRSKGPFRFWSKIGIWAIFYLFAAAFPIGYALQEQAKAAKHNEQAAESKMQQPDAVPSHIPTEAP